MIRAAYQSSLLHRFLRALALIFSGSVPGRILRTLGCAWRHNRLHQRLGRAMKADALWCESSCFSRLLTAFDRWLYRLRPLRMAVHCSLLYRIWGAVLHLLQRSLLLGWIFRGGLTRALLFVIALYIPIDYVLRDVLPIPVLGSVWDEMLLLLCIGWALWMRIDGKTQLHARLNPQDLPVALFLMVALASLILVSPYPAIAISGYRATVQYILWFYIVTRLIRNDGDFFCVYLTIVGIGALIALHGLYQYAVAAPIPSTWMSGGEQAVRTRVYSIFGSPNIMADFMVMVTPMTAGLFLYFKNRWLKLACAIAVICMGMSCLFTMSRGGWIAMAAAALLFVAIIDRRLLAVVLLGCVAALFVPFVWSRISFLISPESIYLMTNGGRISRWLLGISYLFRTNPYFGFGFGMYGGAIAMQTQPLHWVWYTYVDNYYLKLLTEAGFIGFGAFVIMMLSLLICGARVCRRTRENKREHALAAGLVAALGGTLAHCFVENIFEEPYMMATFWVLAGLLIWFGFLRNRTQLPAKVR